MSVASRWTLIVGAMAAVVAHAHPATAQSGFEPLPPTTPADRPSLVPPQALEDQLTLDERLMLQEALVFAGGYNSWVDGDFGPITRQAIRTFQSRYGFAVTSLIGPAEAALLFAIRNEAYADAGFYLANDPASQSSFEVPGNYISDIRPNDYGGSLYYSDEYPSLEISTSHFYANDPIDLQRLYNGLSRFPGSLNTYHVFHQTWFVVNGISNGRYFYHRYHLQDGTIKGITISWSSGATDIMDPITMIITNSYRTSERTNLGVSRSYPNIRRITEDSIAGPGDDDPSSVTEPVIAIVEWGDLSLSGTGSGFFVNGQGYLLTASHVVRNCEAITLMPTGAEARLPTTAPEESVLSVVFADDGSDLAVLSSNIDGTGYVIFRSGSQVRLGEDVAVAGFPLSTILTPDLNITNGVVSSLSGAASENRHLQFTAPVQSGNSGGPLLDVSGNLIGIVVARLDQEATAAAVGSVPENVNFAVKSALAEAALVQAGVEYYERHSVEVLDLADIAEAARRYTAQIGCWN